MEDAAGTFQALPLDRHASHRQTKGRQHKDPFWSRFKPAVRIQEIGGVSHIEYSLLRPHLLAVTTSTRVIVYNTKSGKVHKLFARFKDKAYSGSLRAEGDLLVAGGENGVVQVFDGNKRTLLRQLKGHGRAVHVARFSSDRKHILTCGDDTTIRYWDLVSGEQSQRLDGHSDYVRAAACSPANSNIWVTGSYDHSCRAWDVETGQVVANLDHGAPVEHVVFHPSGTLLVSAGGTEVVIWEALGGWGLVARLQSFQKTVTCVQISPQMGPDSSAETFLLAGSLDGILRVFELSSFSVVHSFILSSPILSFSISQKRCIAVGLSDGKWTTLCHTGAEKAGSLQSGGRAQQYLKTGSHQYMVRGASEKAGAASLVVAAPKKTNLQVFDRQLKQFQFREALDTSLEMGNPTVVSSLLEELACRNALDSALGGRDLQGLLMVLAFTARHMANPQCGNALLSATHRLLDIYSSEVMMSELIAKQWKQMNEKLAMYLHLSSTLQNLLGIVEPMTAVNV